MKKIIILCWLLGWGAIAYSQTIIIKDNDTQEPIELATVVCDSPKVFTITNEKGEADISSFVGAKKIEIRVLGYKTEIRSYEELAKPPFELSMKLATLSGGVLVISATRWEQHSSDVPSKIISISSSDVALLNPQTAADLLGSSGKVFIQKSQQGGGSPMIRGFATNRLLYTVDGVRMNTAIFRGGNIQNVISLDPLAIEHTEVLFGPGSVLYGSDAIGGVMSFQTLTPQFSMTEKPLIKGKALARYSSANTEKTGHFDINVGWKKWSLLTSVSASDYDDLRMGSYGPKEYLRPFYVQRQDSSDVVIANDDPLVQRPSGYSQINIMQKLRFKPSKKLDFQYGFHYSQTSEYSRYDRHIRYKKGAPRYGEWNYGPQKWMMNNLNINHADTNLFYNQMTIRLAHQYFEESRIDRDINKVDRHTRVEKVNAYSFNLDFIKTIGNRNTLTYGVEVIVNDVLSWGFDTDVSTGVEIPGPARYPKAIWASYAVFISDQFKFSDKFLLQGSLRYNHFQIEAEFDTTYYPFNFTKTSSNNGSLTGSLGMVYKPMQDFIISMNAATAFRSPNVDDMGKVFDSEPGAVTIPTPEIGAEYAYNVDLSITKVFFEKVKIDITGYYTNLQNALVRRNYKLNGLDSIWYDGTLSQVQAMQNAAVTQVYGIQAGLEIKLPMGFSIASDFNYQVGEEELDNGQKSPSRHAAPWFGVTRLIYRMNKLTMQLYVQYSGERLFEDMPEEEKGKVEIYAQDKDGNPYAPAWYCMSFKAMYQITKNFGISAGLENITDRRYRPYSSGIVAPGINFMLAVRADF